MLLRSSVVELSVIAHQIFWSICKHKNLWIYGKELTIEVAI